MKGNNMPTGIYKRKQSAPMKERKITIRLSNEDYLILNEICTTNSISQSDYIRSAIKKAFHASHKARKRQTTINPD